VTANYSGQVILVTGSSAGIGRMITEYFLENGAMVLGFSRNSFSLMSQNYQHYICDVADPVSVREAFKKIRADSHCLTGLINNAGALSIFSSLLMPPKVAMEMINTNFLGSFFVAQESAKIMARNQFGRIIGISSMAELLEPVGDAIYSASKAAATSLTNSLAKELAPLGITCNTLAVTHLKTGMSEKIDAKVLQKVLNSLPMPYPARIEDITNVIDFFMSPHSSNITGQFIALGGLHK
jgi:3-oxoacyl-[acyl-carrier protein] reductase